VEIIPLSVIALLLWIAATSGYLVEVLIGVLWLPALIAGIYFYGRIQEKRKRDRIRRFRQICSDPLDI
jgi:hypothetical protein